MLELLETVIGFHGRPGHLELPADPRRAWMFGQMGVAGMAGA
jgi:hypothetical protein